MQKIFFLIALLLLSGCPHYAKPEHHHRIHLSNVEATTYDEIASFLSGFFDSRGLTLSKRQNKVYPSKAHYLAYEIPNRSENAHGNTILTIEITEDKRVIIEELTLRPGWMEHDKSVSEILNALEKALSVEYGQSIIIDRL